MYYYYYYQPVIKLAYIWQTINVAITVSALICLKYDDNPMIIVGYKSWIKYRNQNELLDDGGYNYHPYRLYMIFLATYTAFTAIIMAMYLSFMFVRRIFRRFSSFWSIHKMLITYSFIFETDCICNFIWNIIENGDQVINTIGIEQEWIIIKTLIIAICRWFLLIISTMFTFGYLKRLMISGRYRPKFGWFSQNLCDYLIIRYLYYCYHHNHMSNWLLHWTFTMIIFCFYFVDIRPLVTIFRKTI
ncbi:hypothetical protein HUG17_6437 [Dermatophagoides farinae]|uniref:Uncharacterized protein n=1 Tax=Dermatophagoides farinae TaxID=6954 RepID=A0A9D4P6P1_DERFA|nr:uncharacterized protein LOC124493464 [Dermatophagoides farinae]KAH7644075.1 hypothetical protein HUG17_6437 [Dermatophagoides farinae]